MNSNIISASINAFYHFTKKEGKKTAFVCTHSTGNYAPFEQIRFKGTLRANFSDYDYLKYGTQYRWKLSMKSKHVSILKTSLDYPNISIGDVKGTKDLLIFFVANGFNSFTNISVFVAKGQKGNRQFIRDILQGEYDNELKALKGHATKE